MDTYYVDGDYVDDEKAMISVKDIIVLRGFGIFDFMITYNKRPFYLNDHVRRFENSAMAIGLKLNYSGQEICEIVKRTIEKNPHHDESSVRIVHSGGVSLDGVTPEGNGILMVMVTPKKCPPAWWYQKGASIITVEMERCLPVAKSTNYLSAVFAQQQARKVGAVEAVYVDRSNRVLEGTTSNIFCFKGSTLITPSDDILDGITRKVVLNKIAGNFDLEMRDIDFSELMGMDEIFLSSSNKEILPVVRVNDMTIGSGEPGAGTKKIMQLFRDYTQAWGRGEVA
ncbi:D-amino-acid transaminase [Desulfamplus magnetovallimortis]|uniref:branched-chain-amino-acid transaminase n=1 Tax=Desulfamplus magnetovallimortis TaxID=1246637 RepID=A0A1W1H7D2_9BACT|nr:aminotransferase class IV [Desulfamplus magnetovallimortis]SLM28344.1 D-amino-acid transaminase [Desulfamplus magnetovallimortis]